MSGSCLGQLLFAASIFSIPRMDFQNIFISFRVNIQITPRIANIRMTSYIMVFYDLERPAREILALSSHLLV